MAAFSAGKAEGIPPHRMKHVVSAHALVACNHIADGIIAHMAHVNTARRIGKHLKHVVLRLVRVLGRLERICSPPRIFCHFSSISLAW